MEKKYSIVTNYVNGSYVLVIRCFELDGEGKKINQDSKTFTGLTFEEVQTKIAEING